jgi:hypothetical protein
VSSITIVSDAPNCGVTYDRHYDDRNSFIIQATGIVVFTIVRCSSICSVPYDRNYGAGKARLLARLRC